VTDNPQRGPAFVLHDHRRPRAHFDLRLEQNGVLRSWAVPRGLPTSPGTDRLAIEVADHDLDHLTYHDADKLLADTGWWEEHKRDDRRILFTLHGRRGADRRYALIRTNSDWLLHLTKDQT
jgi:DNA ligase D-like protein (predicted 3'-phosphoesterase)